MGNGDRTVVFVHGILGQGRNWRSFARKLIDRSPGWKAVLVDLRAHGASPRAPPPHDLAACARDLAEVAAKVGPVEVAVGHSFGGKVVLLWAKDASPHAVWVLDSPLSGGREGLPLAGDDPRFVLAQLRDAPVPAAARDDLKQFLRGRGIPEPVVQWLLTSAEQRDDGWRFVYDLDAVEEMLRSYQETNVWPLLERSRCPVHLVRGSRSTVWSEADLARLAALPPDAVVDMQVVDAGHWVHVEAPNALLELIELPA